jgi:hypothetical protein
MALTDDVVIPRRVMTIFFVIDTSASMYGEKIGAVNEAMRKMLPELSKEADNYADFEFKIACLSFSTGCCWMYPKPLPVEQFQWKKLETGSIDQNAFELACSEFDKSFLWSNFALVIFINAVNTAEDHFEFLLGRRKNFCFNYPLKSFVAIANNDKEFTYMSKNIIRATPDTISNLLNKVCMLSIKESVRMYFLSTQIDEYNNKSNFLYAPDVFAQD